MKRVLVSLRALLYYGSAPVRLTPSFEAVLRMVFAGAVETSRENEKEAGQVFPPPFFLLAENPADLTEGGQPVVCWPSY